MRILLTFIACFLFITSQAQCVCTWHKRWYEDTVLKESSYEIKANSNYVTGPDGYVISKKFLDSAILCLQQSLLYQLPRFRAERYETMSDTVTWAITDTIYKHAKYNTIRYTIDGKEIMLLGSRQYFVDDSIEIFRVEYCETWWNEDANRNQIFYTRRYGAIKTDQTGGMVNPMEYAIPEKFLCNNTCLTKEENGKLKQLVGQFIADKHE